MSSEHCAQVLLRLTALTRSYYFQQESQLNSKRPTRRKRTTTSEEPTPKRRPRKTSRAVTEAPRPTAARARRKAKPAKRKFWEETEEQVEAKRSARKKAPAITTRTVHLAMSPRAANLFRAMLGKARHDEPELEAIRLELEDQLDNWKANSR